MWVKELEVSELGEERKMSGTKRNVYMSLILVYMGGAMRRNG